MYAPIAAVPAPFDRHRETVLPEWIDYNGHMNVAYYVLAFDHATDALFAALDLGAAYLARSGCSVFILEQHVVHAAELLAGDPIRVTSQLIAHDGKRLHFFHRMHHGDAGFLAATAELVGINVRLDGRRTAPFPADVLPGLQAMAAAHAALPRPEELGRVIGLERAR